MSTDARRPTIRDVAREAGVSYATVSRVLNGGKWVAPDSQRAVERAIAKTGYRANQAARSLATGRSGNYVFLLTEPQRALFEDPNFAVLFRAAAEEMAERELTLVLLVAGSEGERRRAKEYVHGGHVDGVLLVSPHQGDPLITDLLSAGVPIVSNGAPTWNDRISTVTADDAGGARRAVEHLVAQGRRRIATIIGPSDSRGGHDRHTSYGAVLREHGLAADPSLVAEGDWGRQSGARAMSTLLAVRPDLDAVFAGNDAMAVGAVEVIEGSGRRIPDDVHVVGFDDAAVAEASRPPLTTVRLPFEQISRTMVDLVSDTTREGTVHVTIPTRLIVRSSSPVVGPLTEHDGNRWSPL
ncbi:MAG: LacI family transcriptional regulator [Propionibacteriaceae bacterium]|nr:LacI family transcriptional regulator [Propionibacteriaceae bacterium]